MNNDVLTYQGNVNLDFIINGKVVRLSHKNAGLPYLMKSFAKFITGNYAGNSDIPQYIDLRKFISDELGDRWESVLNQEVVLSGKVYEYDADLLQPNWVAKFTGVIPYSSLQDEIEEEDTSIYALFLKTGLDMNDPEQPYHDIASITVLPKDLARITPGTQAIIEWTMQIVNK